MRCARAQLLEAPFEAEGRNIIQNPAVIPVLFRLFAHLSAPSQHLLLDTFLHLVERVTLNTSLCCAQSLVFDLFGLIPLVADNEELGMRASIRTHAHARAHAQCDY